MLFRSSRRGCQPDFLYAPDLGARVAEQLTVLTPVYQLFWKAQQTAQAQAIHTATAVAAEW